MTIFQNTFKSQNHMIDNNLVNILEDNMCVLRKLSTHLIYFLRPIGPQALLNKSNI